MSGTNLLNIEFYHFKGTVFIGEHFITTKPEFNVVSGRLGKLLAEPWWRVEAATGAGGTTATAILERVMGIYSVLTTVSTTCFTEVVLSNKWRYDSPKLGVSSCAWAYPLVA